MINTAKISFVLLILAIFLIISLILMLPYINIKDEYHEGEAYGLLIGDTKAQTYKKASSYLPREAYRKGGVFLLVEVSKAMSPAVASAPGRKIFVRTYLEEVGYSYYKSKDEWIFFFGPSSFNYIELKFCDEKLCKIRRVNTRMEFP